jgi:hypothetical protein
MDADYLHKNDGMASLPDKVSESDGCKLVSCPLGVRVDYPHPCAELECGELPVRMCDAQAVWLGDKLYVGGEIFSTLHL